MIDKAIFICNWYVYDLFIVVPSLIKSPRLISGVPTDGGYSALYANSIIME